MDTSEIFVLIAGVFFIALTLWYFFAPHEKSEAKQSMSGLQEIDVLVKGGYSPDTVVVRQGIPVRINFRREETASCSEQVVFGDFGIVRDLPAHKTTSVEFTPDKQGEFTFTCGMNMLRGKLVVQA